jgi:competence protein ComEA
MSELGLSDNINTEEANQMGKKILLAIAAFIATMGFAFAQVDVNKADQAALDSIKGIGPKISKTIVDERKKGGNFKDWADFENRVKGIGDKNSSKLSQAGLTVNGQSKPNAPAAAAKDTKKETKAEAKGTKADAKASAKDAKKDDTKK